MSFFLSWVLRDDFYSYPFFYRFSCSLGMGGQFEYWGLWIDSEYGIGECSETCTTYKNYIQLSATKSFKIRNVEVWGVGEKPKSEEVWKLFSSFRLSSLLILCLFGIIFFVFQMNSSFLRLKFLSGV